MISNLNELVRNEKLSIRKVESQFYLLAGADCYKVNNTGVIITNAIGKDMTITELCKKLGAKFGYNDLVQIEQDVNNFIDFLIEEELVSHANG